MPHPTERPTQVSTGQQGWQYQRVTLDFAGQLTNAIRWGNVADVRELLAAQPGLATARIHGGRTALHVATDWPG